MARCVYAPAPRSIDARVTPPSGRVLTACDRSSTTRDHVRHWESREATPSAAAYVPSPQHTPSPRLVPNARNSDSLNAPCTRDVSEADATKSLFRRFHCSFLFSTSPRVQPGQARATREDTPVCLTVQELASATETGARSVQHGRLAAAASASALARRAVRTRQTCTDAYTRLRPQPHSACQTRTRTRTQRHPLRAHRQGETGPANQPCARTPLGLKEEATAPSEFPRLGCTHARHSTVRDVCHSRDYNLPHTFERGRAGPDHEKHGRGGCGPEERRETESRAEGAGSRMNAPRALSAGACPPRTPPLAQSDVHVERPESACVGCSHNALAELTKDAHVGETHGSANQVHSTPVSHYNAAHSIRRPPVPPPRDPRPPRHPRRPTRAPTGSTRRS